MNRISKKIGFIGIGVMGKSMAMNLLKGGHTLYIYSRTKEKAQTLIECGATWMESIADLAKQSDIIITMVGSPQDVADVYFGDDGLIENAKKGSYLIDMTTQNHLLRKGYIRKHLTKVSIHLMHQFREGTLGQGTQH